MNFLTRYYKRDLQFGLGLLLFVTIIIIESASTMGGALKRKSYV